MPNRATVRDLAEEAKKRIVFLLICVVGLSYLMSCKFSVSVISFKPLLHLVQFVVILFGLFPGRLVLSNQTKSSYVSF